MLRFYRKYVDIILKSKFVFIFSIIFHPKNFSTKLEKSYVMSNFSSLKKIINFRMLIISLLSFLCTVIYSTNKWNDFLSNLACVLKNILKTCHTNFAYISRLQNTFWVDNSKFRISCLKIKTQNYDFLKIGYKIYGQIL